MTRHHPIRRRKPFRPSRFLPTFTVPRIDPLDWEEVFSCPRGADREDTR